MSIIKSDNYAIQKAINLVGNEVICKLEEFYQKTSLIENHYKHYALALIKETLTVNHSGDTKKQLTELLLGLGFKKSNVTKMIGAQDFINLLEHDKSHAAPAVKALPVSTAYLLGTCSRDTFNKIWAIDWEWGNASITQKQVESLKNKYEKVSAETPHYNPQSTEELRLEKALKLLSPYPEYQDIVELIQQKLAQD